MSSFRTYSLALAGCALALTVPATAQDSIDPVDPLDAFLLRRLPGVGRIANAAKQPLLVTRYPVLMLGLFHKRSALFNQAIVLGNTHDIKDMVSLAPLKHPVAAKPAVASEDDLYLRPY